MLTNICCTVIKQLWKLWKVTTKKSQNLLRFVPKKSTCDNRSKIDIDLENLPTDPGLRTPISEYDPNIRDQVRRAYIQRGPCQPRNHKYPLKQFGNQSRKFNVSWFDEHSNWLEYSIKKDAAFCLCCYLFKPNLAE